MTEKRTQKRFRLTAKAVLRLCGFVCVCLSVCLSISACTTLVEKAGNFLDGSLFAEKRLAVYRTKPKGGSSVTLTRLRDSSERLAVAVEAHPTLLFYGTAPDAAGRVMLTGCSFLASGVDGWNEFLADAAGEAVFSADDGGAARFFLTQPLETGEISFARLRRADTRLTGERAVSVLSNRRERLRALADWMKEQPGAPAFKSRREFEAYWKPVLLPETVPARKRPADWQKTDAEWVFAEETRWNAAYTKRLFPEALQPLRDTGALLRDWEEAAAWLYLEYDWDNVVQSLTEGLTLTKTRK